MLIEFSITNFLSFKEKNTFSMIASSDNTLEDNFTSIGNEKLLKMTALYGANASGKSNLFKILALISNMIRQSNFINPNVLLPIIPFKLDKETIFKGTKDSKWVCMNCGYIYEGAEAPQKCPLCGYPKSYFKPYCKIEN